MYVAVIISAVIRKTWNKVSVYLYYTGRPKRINPISYLRDKYEIACLDKIATIYPKLYTTIQHMSDRSRSMGCEYGDYLQIYEHIRNNKPSCVLECGSGISSAVIALALKENFSETDKKSDFVSLEENVAFVENVKAILPKSLNEYVTFVHSERTTSDYNGYLGCHYKSVPPKPYDFIFIDGPSFRRKPGEKKGFNSDLINLLINSQTDNNIDGIIDQRIGTLRMFKKLIPKAEIKYNVIQKLGRIHSAHRNNLIEELK
jgi:hypothetical protein